MGLTPIQHKLLLRRKIVDRLFVALGAALAVFCLSVLAMMIAALIRDGSSRFGWSFLTQFPSSDPEIAGVRSAFVGTILVMIVTAATAIPLGVMAGIYLEEYARKNWFTAVIEINIANLAGVPSIIWGLMALGLLVQYLNTGRSVLTAGLTLGLLVLPIVIVATREAIRAIPQAIREASYACGATRLQTVRYHIVPYAMPGVLTGCIIAMSRAIGETAPLVTIGALTYVAYLPPPPLSERPWLLGTVSGLTFSEEVRTTPFAALPPAFAVGATRAGEIEFDVRLEAAGPSQRTVVNVEDSATLTPAGLAEAVDAVQGVLARFDDDGHLRFESELDEWFLISRDTTGIVEGLGMERGGGRHGFLDWVNSGFTVVPIQMYDWVSRPEGQGFKANAAAAGILLVTMTLAMNASAIYLRNRLRRSIRW